MRFKWETLFVLSVPYSPLASLCPLFSFGLAYLFLHPAQFTSLFLICLVPLLLCCNFGIGTYLILFRLLCWTAQVGVALTAAIYFWALEAGKCTPRLLWIWPLIRPSHCPHVVKRGADTCRLFMLYQWAWIPPLQAPSHNLITAQMLSLLALLYWSLGVHNFKPLDF